MSGETILIVDDEPVFARVAGGANIKVWPIAAASPPEGERPLPDGSRHSPPPKNARDPVFDGVDLIAWIYGMGSVAWTVQDRFLVPEDGNPHRRAYICLARSWARARGVGSDGDDQADFRFDQHPAQS